MKHLRLPLPAAVLLAVSAAAAFALSGTRIAAAAAGGGFGAETAAPAEARGRARRSAASPLGATPAAASAAPASLQERQKIDAELVTLRPAGFEPAELSRIGGHFLLAVNNRSGQDGLTMRLVRDNGESQRDASLGRRIRWRERVNLPPGVYALTVDGRPGWTCRVTVN